MPDTIVCARCHCECDDDTFTTMHMLGGEMICLHTQENECIAALGLERASLTKRVEILERAIAALTAALFSIRWA